MVGEGSLHGILLKYRGKKEESKPKGRLLIKRPLNVSLKKKKG